MEGLELQAKGAALDISNLAVSANGNIIANFDTQDHSICNMLITVTNFPGSCRLLNQAIREYAPY